MTPNHVTRNLAGGRAPFSSRKLRPQKTELPTLFLCNICKLSFQALIQHTAQSWIASETEIAGTFCPASALFAVAGLRLYRRGRALRKQRIKLSPPPPCHPLRCRTILTCTIIGLAANAMLLELRPIVPDARVRHATATALHDRRRRVVLRPPPTPTFPPPVELRGHGAARPHFVDVLAALAVVT